MKKITLLIVTLLSWPVLAQEQNFSYSLEEAITYALEHNYNSINASRDLIDAQKQKWETIATGLPQISGAVNYQNQLKQQVVQLPGEIAGGDPGKTCLKLKKSLKMV